MPKIELTQEELDLLLITVHVQKEGDFVRWKTLTSFLPSNTPLTHTEKHMTEHLQKHKTYTDILTKLKEAKKEPVPIKVCGWFK